MRQAHSDTARAILDARPCAPAKTVGGINKTVLGAQCALDNAALFIADAIRSRAPRFDREGFLKAAGYGSWK